MCTVRARCCSSGRRTYIYIYHTPIRTFWTEREKPFFITSLSPLPLPSHSRPSLSVRSYSAVSFAHNTISNCPETRDARIIIVAEAVSVERTFSYYLMCVCVCVCVHKLRTWMFMTWQVFEYLLGYEYFFTTLL